jgi:hypothetical protein
MTSDGLMLADSMLADSMPKDEMRADHLLADELPADELLVDDDDVDPVTERDFTRPGSLVAQHEDSEPSTSSQNAGSADDKHMDSRIVEELTNRLPTSELIKIIKNALECGRRNVPFTESDLLRAMTFGSSFGGSSSFAGSRQQGQHGARQPGARTPGSSRS